MTPQARKRWMIALWIMGGVAALLIIAPLGKIATALHP